MSQQRERIALVFATLLCLSFSFMFVKSYKPVIMMHGINGHADDFASVKKFISESHPGTPLFALNISQGMSSVFASMEDQLEIFRVEIERLKHENQFDEFHLICHSQGGLICRGYLETQDNHTCNHFISLQSPQYGQFGLTGMVEEYLPILRNLTREVVYSILYLPYVRDHVSISGYWRDPFHYEEYLKAKSYLAMLNGEISTSESVNLKRNFLRLKKLILCASTNDEVIEPRLSSIFNFWKVNTTTYEMLEMKEQLLYKEDTFGLKTMDERGDLTLHIDHKARHMDWVTSREIYDQYIEPHLD